MVEMATPPTTPSPPIPLSTTRASTHLSVVAVLGDIFGKRRLLLVSLLILGVGTVLAATAGSVGMLIAARAVQGLGGGTFPLAFGIARDSFVRERVTVAIGTISAVFGVGFGVGLVVPGPITDSLGWQWLFWISLIPTVAAFGAVRVFISRDSEGKGGSVDWTGGVLLAVGFVALLLVIGQARLWSVGALGGVAALSAVALVAFGAVESRVRAPLIDLRVLRRRALVTANLSALVIGFGMYGAFTLVPQLVQAAPEAGFGFGATVTESGLYLLPMAVTMLFAGPVAGRIGPRIGFGTTLVLACVIGALGFCFFAAGHRVIGAIVVGSGVLGVGVGFAFSALANIVVGAVDPQATGEATGVNTIVRTIGGSLGALVAATIVASTAPAETGVPTAGGYTAAFGISAVALAAAAIIAAVGTRGKVA